jgi:alpha-glucosidase
MVWQADNQSGGFTTGNPWLPVPSDHLRLAVASAEHDPAALLHHYRRAISFRRSHTALRAGRQSRVAAEGEVLAFTRSDDHETIFCAFNLRPEPGEIGFPDGDWEQIGMELNSTAAGDDGKVHLGPWQCCLAIRTTG